MARMIDHGYIVWKNDHFDILQIKEAREFFGGLYQERLTALEELKAVAG